MVKWLTAEINLKKLAFYTLYFSIIYFVLTILFYLFSEHGDEKIAKLIESKEQSCGYDWTQKELCEARTKSLENQVMNCDNKCSTSIPEHTKEFYTVDINKTEWHTFSSARLGILFKYPVEKDSKVAMNYVSFPDSDNDPRGSEITFKVKPNSLDYGWQQTAVASSSNLLFGRDPIEPDAYKWISEDDQTFLLENDGKSKINVTSLGQWVSTFGTKALLYDTDSCKGVMGDEVSYFCKGFSRRLIVNLPEDYNEDFQSLRFIIPDSFTKDDIELLLDSIQLTN